VKTEDKIEKMVTLSTFSYTVCDVNLKLFMISAGATFSYDWQVAISNA
jgi:hypothetical protein